MLPEGEGQPSDFSALKQYRDGRWQASNEFPTTAPFGHAYLGKTGGHTTSDPSLGVIRRYTAPQNEKVTLEGRIRHNSKQGDGVTFSIQTNGKQIYASTQLNSQQRHGPHSIKLNAGDVIDLIATPGRTSSFDSFEWTAKIQSEPKQDKGQGSERDTTKHFSGPFEIEKIQSMDRLEQLAQILILSNEFAFID